MIDITEAALTINGWRVHKHPLQSFRDPQDSSVIRRKDDWTVTGPDGTSFRGDPEYVAELAVNHDKGLCWRGWSVAMNVGGLVARKRRADGVLFERVGTTIEKLASLVASWEAAQV